MYSLIVSILGEKNANAPDNVDVGCIVEYIIKENKFRKLEI